MEAYFLQESSSSVDDIHASRTLGTRKLDVDADPLLSAREGRDFLRPFNPGVLFPHETMRHTTCVYSQQSHRTCTDRADVRELQEAALDGTAWVLGDDERGALMVDVCMVHWSVDPDK